MNILGIVPARGGSKRIPRKNVRTLGGVPLIEWTLRSARQAACLNRVVVSTDDAEIAETVRRAGAEVPVLRSARASTDEANVVLAIVEMLDWLERNETYRPEAVMLLQPTSPFRSVQTIEESARMFANSRGESVISVGPVDDHPWWCKTVDSDGVIHPYLNDVKKDRRSQDLPPVYIVNGLVYLSSVGNIRNNSSLYSEKSRALIVDDKLEAIDIDTEFDWLVAESVVRQGRL